MGEGRLVTCKEKEGHSGEAWKRSPRGGSHMGGRPGRAGEWLQPPALISVLPESRVLCFLPKGDGEVEKRTENVEAWGTS